ncbi:MAG: zinc-dependent alcohol dehydrogenase family protein [Planctomycetaceae bacterium]
MQAVVFEQFGEPADVLRVQDRPDPQPGPGEVRVRMIAAPINPSDAMTIRGVYPRLPDPPAVPGYDGVGVVERSGGGLLGRLVTGKRVAVGHRLGGTWADFAVVPAEQVMPIPKGVSDEQGAMFFVTAFAMTRRVLAVPAGEWLLQTAAGSALGRMVIRLGRRFGFRTLNVVRRAEQIDELKSLGGDAVVPFDERQHAPEQLRERITTFVGADGVRFAIDPVGGATGSAAVNCLGRGGRLLTFGSLSDVPVTVSPRALITPGAAVEGFWLTHYMDGLGLLGKLRLIKRVGRLVRDGVLAAEVGEVFPLVDVRNAATASERVGRGGKVLLRIG